MAMALTVTQTPTRRSISRFWKLILASLTILGIGSIAIQLRVSDKFINLVDYEDGAMHLVMTDAMDRELTEKEESAALLGLDENKTGDSSNGTSPWVQEYISFHQSSIENGKLKDGVKYLIYECIDGPNLCGGAGDRLIGMLKMFYLAMMTNRVLLIDAPFPIPLTEVFEPAQIEWNASFPETNLYFPDLDYTVQPRLRPTILGYRIPRTNGIPRKTGFDELWESGLMLDHLEKGNWTAQAEETTLARAAHEAFQAMFQFAIVVKTKAQELKSQAGILGKDGTSPPYLGMHMRTGDTNMGVARKDGKNKYWHTTHINEYRSCYRELKKTHPGKFQVAYFASDTKTTKIEMSKGDKTIRYMEDLKPFHIDLSTRTNSVAKTIKVDEATVYNGVIEAWAEMLVLAQSTCLILSKSLFVFGSSFMRDPKACSVPLDRCNQAVHRTGRIEYFAENISERGFYLSVGKGLRKW